MAKRYVATKRPGVGGAPKGTVPWNKGKKREITWGANISAALKGREIPWKDKIGDALRGRKRPGVGGRTPGFTAHTKGLRKATHPDLVKCGNPGERHWNWQGGISKINNRLRQTSRYKAWRDAVFRRDNWTCVKCHQRGGQLEADHIKQFSIHIEDRFNVENGRTLCKSCHKIVTREQRRKNNLTRRDENRAPKADVEGTIGPLEATG